MPVSSKRLRGQHSGMERGGGGGGGGGGVSGLRDYIAILHGSIGNY